MIKREIERKSKSKHLSNFGLLGSLMVSGTKVSIFTAKGTSVRECSTSIEPFCVRSVGESGHQGAAGIKSKSQRLP